MAKGLLNIWRHIPARAKVMLIGTVLVSAGAAWIYPPAGLVAAGLVCLVDAGRQTPQRRR